jgi:hypothetical protein
MCYVNLKRSIIIHDPWLPLQMVRASKVQRHFHLRPSPRIQPTSSQRKSRKRTRRIHDLHVGRSAHDRTPSTSSILLPFSCLLAGFRFSTLIYALRGRGFSVLVEMSPATRTGLSFLRLGLLAWTQERLRWSLYR